MRQKQLGDDEIIMRIPKRVKVSTIVKNIRSGKYNINVFYTSPQVFCAWIIRCVEGEEALSLALQFLNEWGVSDGKVEKMIKSDTKHFLDKELWGHRNLYTDCSLANAFSDKPAYISLVKKRDLPTLS